MTGSRIRWLVGSGLFLVAALVAAFLGAGHFLVTESQSPDKADLLVVLGGDNGARVDRAVELYAKGFAPKVLVVGIEGGHRKTRDHYLNWRAQYLVDNGIPRHALIFDRQSASSWEEAVNTRQLMQSSRFRRVLVVSDPPHLRRLVWVWGKVFSGTGIKVQLAAAPMENWDASRWWSNSASAQFVMAEYVKLAYYLFTY